MNSAMENIVMTAAKHMENFESAFVHTATAAKQMTADRLAKVYKYATAAKPNMEKLPCQYFAGMRRNNRKLKHDRYDLSLTILLGLMTTIASPYLLVCIIPAFIAWIFITIRKAPQNLTPRRITEGFEQQSDFSISNNEVLGFLKTILGAFALPITFLVALTTSLIGLITSAIIYKRTKKPGALHKTNLINALINFIATISMGLVTWGKIDDETTEQITAMAPVIAQAIVEPSVKDSPKQRYLEMTKGIRCPIKLNRIYRDNFDETDFHLPHASLPSVYPDSLRRNAIGFTFPDEFLSRWWQAPMEAIAVRRKMYSMCSPHGTHSDRDSDGVFQDWTDENEHVTARIVKNDSDTNWSDLVRRIKRNESTDSEEGRPNLPPREVLLRDATSPSEYTTASEEVYWDAPQRPCWKSPNRKHENTPFLRYAARQRRDLNAFFQQGMFDDMTSDTVVAFVKKIITKVACVFMAFADSAISKRPVSMKGIMDYWKTAATLDEACTDVKDALATLVGKNTEEDNMLDQVRTFSDKFNRFMDLPNHVIARNLRYLSDIEKVCRSYEEWQRVLPREFQTKFLALHTLFTAASKKRVDFVTAEMPTLSRQEPFVVLLRGETGIGKTQLAREIAARVCTDILRVYPADGCVDITPSDKYWPPLNGMKDVYLFDEVVSCTDIQKDLLFGNLRGICSPAYFNCAGADIPHKLNPFTGKVLIATTNTKFEDIAARVCANADAEAWAAYCRRMIILECRRPANLMFDANHPENSDWDRTNFTHINSNLFEYRDGRLQEVLSNLRLPQVMDLIREREAAAANKHIAALQRMTLVQEDSKSHYSFVLHGKAGQGKTYVLSHLKNELACSLNLDYYEINSAEELHSFPVQKNRIICVIDDVVRNSINERVESDLMDLYNYRLVAGSILINTTNVTPRSTLPKWGGFSLSNNREVPFVNEGVARRMGYTGIIGGSYLPSFNDECYVVNQNYFVIKENGYISVKKVLWVLVSLPFAWFSIWLSLLIASSVLGYLWWKIATDVMIGMPATDLPRYLYKRYREYLVKQKEIPICYTTFNKKADYNLLISADRGDSIVMGSDTKAFRNNVFSTRSLYDQCNLPWKMFVAPEVFSLLGRNYQRFLIHSNGFNFAIMMSVIKKYAHALEDLGIVPKFFVEIQDLGRFEYYNGVVNADLIGNPLSQIQFNYVKTQSEWLIRFGKFTFPLGKILQTPNLVDELDLSFDEAQQVNRYFSSTEFKSHYAVVETSRQMLLDQIEYECLAKAKRVQNIVQKFYDHPLGKIVLVIMTIAVSMGLLYKCVQWLKPKPAPLKENRSDESESEDEDEEPEKKRVSKKGSPKTKAYDSDDDKGRKQDAEKKRATKKGSPKNKGDITDDDKPKKKTWQKQDVMNLVDMNGYNSFKPYIDAAYREARENLAQVYFSPCTAEDDVLENEPTGHQSCYALFICGTLMVTVGHIKSQGLTSYYVGSDKFPGFHRMRFIMDYNYRDMSVWYVPTLEKTVNHKDISKRFLSSANLENDTIYNAVIQRFAENKTLEYHTGEMLICRGIANFGSFSLADYGQIAFGTTDIKVTTGGDCGLPYYCVEDLNLLKNKIFGIHCMGNSRGYDTVGVLSLITTEDITTWKSKYSLAKKGKEFKNSEVTDCCEIKQKLGLDTIKILADDKPKFPGHLTTWHNGHDSTLESFLDEYSHFQSVYTDWRGMIVKHSGNLMGSVEHSHTQFFPNQTYEGLYGEWKAHGWLKTTTTAIGIDKADGEEVFHRRGILNPEGLTRHIRRNLDMGNSFRIRIESFIDAKKNPKLRVELIYLANSISPQAYERLSSMETIEFIQQLESDVSTLQVPFGKPVYAPSVIREIISNAEITKMRGKQEDTPFSKVENNETVKVIGCFATDKSPLPGNHYKISPFSNLLSDSIPIEKKPVVYDMDAIPEDEKLLMMKDTYGNPNQRVTQAIQWAHQDFRSNPGMIKVVSGEFMTKIMNHYSNLYIMDDYAVIGGLPSTHKDSRSFKGMELDTAIGFTMKQLYHVQKKNDVIGVNDKGRYYWTNNAASLCLKQMYEDAKEISSRGDPYFVAYLEMMKMEKLKLSKIYTGRSFVVQDILGVLMERRHLGAFGIQAMKSDPNCGIGVDPQKDFHRLYVRLSKHPNIWAGDYKRFDRTEPAIVFEEISKLLQQANPHMRNEIRSTFETIIHRFQVTGNTLTRVRGGMPSGCYSTAALNSLVNEYLLFACYCFLMKKRDLEFSWELYEKNIERIVYGDDVFVSVSDEYSQIFTRTNVSKVMMNEFGMFLDSAAKDGTVATFDNWQTGTWISRTWRKIDQYPFIVGALKKVSILANFHYVTSTNLDHIGELMTKSLYEAAFWEEEFYFFVLKQIQRCIEHTPALRRHVQIVDRLRIQRETYEAALPALCTRSDKQTYNKISNCDLSNKLQPNILDRGNCIATPESKRPVYSKQRHTAKYRRQVLHCLATIYPEKLDDMANSYRGKLNLLFQQGKITKPVYEYKETAPQLWLCFLSVFSLVDGKEGENFRGCGTGHSKAECSEEAAKEVWDEYNRKKEKPKRPERLNLEQFEQQMNMTPQATNKVPDMPFLAPDVSVVPDAGIYTNKGAPAMAVDINTDAIALDNPAGTGAAFDKKLSCYNIYQEHINGVINPSMATGTEVFRITLDPSTWPRYIQEYVLFHDSIIPAIESLVQIAGAAGTIGWLKFGWVKDGSKRSYTSNDLQQVVSKVVNMNGTQVLHFVLNDVRRMGLYRKTKNDTEPWPAIVCIVEHAVTNVQRNDSVNYPFRIQTKLAPNCILMEPFSSSGPSPGGDDFDLGSYFYDNQLDMVVLSTNVPNQSGVVTNLPECGYNTKQFEPTFTHNNLLACTRDMQEYTDDRFMAFTTDKTPSADYITQLSSIGKPADMDNNIFPTKIFFGYGQIPIERSFNKYDSQFKIEGSTVYKATYKVQIGPCLYQNAILHAFSDGCVIELSPNYTIQNIKSEDGVFPCIIYTESAILKGDPTTEDVASFYKTVKLARPQAFVNIAGSGDTNVVISMPIFDNNEIPIDDAFPIKLTDTSLTFVCTGNSAPSTPLPTGLKQIAFMRRGTSTTEANDTPVVALEKPLIKGAYQALSKKLTSMDTKAFKANLTIDDEIIGEVGYVDNTLIVRTDDFKLIKANVGNNIMLKEIKSIKDLKELQAFNTKGMTSWIASGSRTKARRFDLSSFVFEMEAAAFGIGQGLSGFGQMMFQQMQQEREYRFRREMQEQLLANNRAIADANQAGLTLRQQKAFDNSMALKGASSTSAQMGGLGGTPGLGSQPLSSNFIYSHTFTPQTRNQLNDKPYRTEQDKNASLGTRIANLNADQDDVESSLPSVEEAHKWAEGQRTDEDLKNDMMEATITPPKEVKTATLIGSNFAHPGMIANPSKATVIDPHASA